MALSQPAMQTRVHGKWILAGEHAVLRGVPALVFPVLGRSLTLRYFEGPEELSANFAGECGNELHLLFWGVMERALATVGHTRNEVLGRFELESDIPIGAGLGASAALCVGIGRWCAWKGWVEESALYDFSRELENLFHGESSGVDIAVALTSQGLHFERNGRRSTIEPKWHPHWYISYSGQRGVTSECVAKVKRLWQTDEIFAQTIDADMGAAAARAEQALLSDYSEENFKLLADAVELAGSCFERWGLADGEIGRHIGLLRERGAIAVKPTGSGGGGFVLSLWRERPPAEIRTQLIAVGPKT